MKIFSISALTISLMLVSCSQRDTVAGPAAAVVAAQYCARDFKPWLGVVDACTLEGRNGKRGSSCAVLEQVNTILEKRLRESGFKECTPPELRWGANGSNK